MSENDQSTNIQTPTPTEAPDRDVEGLAKDIAFSPLGILGILWALLPALGGFTLIYFINDASEWLESHDRAGVAIYAAVFILAAGVGVLPTYAQAFLGGWAFGPVWGMAGALTGFVGAALLGGAIARRVGRDRVEDAFAKRPDLRLVRDALMTANIWRATLIVMLVRIPPNSPFALTNLVLSTSGVRVVPYVVGTAVGMAPRTFVAIYLAHQAKIAIGDRTLLDVIKDRPSWMLVGGIAIAVVVFVILYYIGKTTLRRVLGPAPDKAPEPERDADA